MLESGQGVGRCGRDWPGSRWGRQDARWRSLSVRASTSASRASSGNYAEAPTEPPAVHVPRDGPPPAADSICTHHTRLGQLSLASLPCAGATSTSDSCDVNRHTAGCTSFVSVVSKCELVSGW